MFIIALYILIYIMVLHHGAALLLYIPTVFTLNKTTSSKSSLNCLLLKQKLLHYMDQLDLLRLIDIYKLEVLKFMFSFKKKFFQNV